jgi:hypothetical protein
MHASCLVPLSVPLTVPMAALAALATFATFATAGAQARSPDTAPAPHPYVRNEADSSGNAVMNNNKASFDAWVTDPRLVAGVDLTPNLAIETGIVNLYDRGTFYAEHTRRENVAGAFGSGGFNSYLAAKVMLPLTDRLQAYGKVGRAYSEYDSRDEHHAALIRTDAGPYVGTGAQYKLHDRATVSGGYARYGDAQKWGSASNNNGISARVKLGF